MFAGPVCHFELVRIARQGRLFALRFGFGMVVLGMIAVNYLGHIQPGRPWYSPVVLSIGESAQFGQALFTAIMATQAALILGLTPALVADSVASERHKKTLHYLLASALGSGAIVVGKLAARLISVGVFPALVLPVVSLLTLIGGVSPAGLVLGYLALASSAYFLASLGLLASVLARRPRDAVGAAYALTAAWLFLPPLLDTWLPLLMAPRVEIAHAITVVIAWLWPASPLGLVTSAPSVYGSGSNELARLLFWMVGSQAVYGTLFTTLAAWQLRPAFRRHEGREGRQTRTTRLARRWFPLRPCGDDPVFWKEAYFSPAAGGLGRRLARVALFCVLAGAVVGALVALALRLELGEHGFGAGNREHYIQRLMLNFGLRYGGTVLIGIWMLWLAGLTAGGISSELEQDTWIGLLATPLERGEILRGKMLGPLRATALFGVTLVVLWLIGCAAGAVHPLGLVSAIVVLALLVWFAIALGTYASLKWKVTWKARLWAAGILIVPNICCFVSPLWLAGLSLWSYAEIDTLRSGVWIDEPEMVRFACGYFFGGMALTAGAAYVLTRAASRRFDVLANRPVLSHSVTSPRA